MENNTPNTKKLCLFQWVFVLLMGLLGAVIGGTGIFSPNGQPGGYREVGIGLVPALSVSGIGVSLYMRWKRARQV